MAGALVSVPQGWPGPDVNIQVWGMRERVYCRVTHRATGLTAFTSNDDDRHALAFCLILLQRKLAAYRLLGLA